MAVVTDHLVQLVAKQVDEKGLVVWYCPERHLSIEKVADLIRNRRNDTGHPQDPPVKPCHEEKTVALPAIIQFIKGEASLTVGEKTVVGETRRPGRSWEAHCRPSCRSTRGTTSESAPSRVGGSAFQPCQPPGVRSRSDVSLQDTPAVNDAIRRTFTKLS